MASYSLAQSTIATNPDWYSRAATFLAAKIPQLTTFIPVKMGISPNALGTANWVDANVEGGAIKSGSAWAMAGTGTTFQTTKTGKYGFVMRARLSALATAHGYLGMVNSAGTNHVTLRSMSTIDATNFVLCIQSGGTTAPTVSSTVVADRLWHDFAFTMDATTYSVYMDSISQGASATAIAATTNFTNLIDEGMSPGWHFDSGASSTDVSDVLYGYIAP